MGFKDDMREAAEDFRDELAVLHGRVNALEKLAEQIRRGDTRTVAAVTRELSTTAARSTLDYGAVAFGLSEIKRKVAELIQGGSADMAYAARERAAEEYVGAVDYFADVFAKADPAFNREEFNHLAQR